MLIFPAPQATFNTVPTGGVSKPKTVIKINTTPKYATSIPAAFTAGSNTGVRIIMVGVTSMEVPTKSTIRQIININAVGCSINGARIPVTIDGTFATVIIQDDTMAAAARNMITDEDFAAETRHSISILIFNSLYTKSPITNAYTAAITPASVGVNLPLRSPTRINTGRINAQSPSSNAFATCFADCLSAFARLSFFAIKNHNTHKAPDKYTAGAIPPINNFVTETPACTPKIIIGTDGGMIGDKIFPAAISPVQVSRL